MADEVKLGALKTAARQLSDTENDSNISEAELTSLANRHASDLHDRIADAGPADHIASTTQITTSSGIIPYALPANFRNLNEVYVRENSSGQVRRLLPMPEGTRANYKAPTAAYTLDVEYTPTFTPFEDDDSTIDGVSGWAELIANLMARDIMVKRESDPSVVLNNIARLEARIAQHSRGRDRSPKRITDLDEVNAWTANYPDWTVAVGLSCYRLRASNIELYESLSGIP